MGDYSKQSISKLINAIVTANNLYFSSPLRYQRSGHILATIDASCGMDAHGCAVTEGRPMISTRLSAALLHKPITLAAFANSEPPGPERFITDLQLAARWHVHPSTIWRNAKKTPTYPQPVKLSARVTRFRLSDVERFERKEYLQSKAGER
ncbi:helix-turn-helix transcriptional regulator [Bradyrhizobium arachidis]|nr:hypothetical protein [Bradyrhizobium arachidis]